MTKFTPPGLGALALWRAPPLRIVRGRGWRSRVAGFCLGALATAVMAACVWRFAPPDAVVRTRIVADGGSAAMGRTALAMAALPFAARPGDPVTLRDGGATLEVSASDRDPAVARQRARSLVDTILNAPGPAAPSSLTAAALGNPSLAERMRLLDAATVATAQAASVSASLTAVARDLSASLRATAERKAVRATPDKGAATLADMQIMRFQLLARYQADFPAVLALEGQIRDLRAFLADEARRQEAVRALPPDPADTVLTTERDRLRANLVQLDDHRRGLATEIADIDRRLAATPQAAAVETSVAPVLVEAATTVETGPDARGGVIAGLSAVGLSLCALSMLVGRRRARDVGAGWTQPSFTALPQGGYTLLTPGDDHAGGQPVWLRLPAKSAGEADYSRS